MSTFVIKINDVDITDDVIFGDTEFVSQASGSPGLSRIRVKDTAHIWQFTVGHEVTLDIDGRRMWGGYATAIKRGYFFPVDDSVTRQPCDPPRLVPRALVIEAADYNILFRRRFLFNESRPTDMALRSWPAGTHDDVVIRDICENFLDLDGDGIDFTSKVEHVGSPNPDAKGNPAGAGYSWDQAMQAISTPTGAIYYIDPDKVLVYTDVDTPNAAFELSDNPGPGQLGYRDMDLLFSGTDLRNDALVWGVGQGAPQAKFTRTEDADSIAAHGRWQVGEFRQDLWRQASVDKRSQSLVYGSPQNKRGGKDDAVSVTLSLFHPAFRVAEKVVFESEVFGFTDVIPIRRQRINFISPTEARYDLVLSHFIDEPWNTFEYWFPRIDIPPIKIPPIRIGDGNWDNCPTFSPGAGILAAPGFVMFSDDFSLPRVNGQPPNGCGRHTFGGKTLNPALLYSPVVTDGYGTVRYGGFTVFNYPYSGAFEILMALDLTLTLGLPFVSTRNIQMTAASVTFSIGQDGSLATTDFNTFPTTFHSTQAAASGAFATKVYVRMGVDAINRAYLKVWPQSQAEPPGQMHVGPAIAGDRTPLHDIGYNGNFVDQFTRPMKLGAMTVYALGQDTAREFTTTEYLLGGTGLGWTASWHQAPPNTGGGYIGWGGPASSAVSRYNIGLSPQPSTPTAQLFVQRDQFTFEPLIMRDYVESIVLFRTLPDNWDSFYAETALPATSVTIRGEISCSLSGGGLGEIYGGGQPVEDISIELVKYNYGFDPIFTYPFTILGSTTQTILVQGHHNTGGVPVTWYPFEFEVAEADIVDGVLAWGVRFQDPQAAIANQPIMGGGLLLVAQRDYTIACRNVTYDFNYAGRLCGTSFCDGEFHHGGTSVTKICQGVFNPGGSPWIAQLTESYQQGSVEVWLDGMLARQGTDFVEKDPAAGTVTMLGSTTNANSVRICFLPINVNSQEAP